MTGERTMMQFDLFTDLGNEKDGMRVVASSKSVELQKSVVDTTDRTSIVPVVVAAAPTALVSTNSDSRVIEDAGEELVHNRRNRIRTATVWSDISHLNDALKVKEAVKSNIWPKPDYARLIADGMEPIVAHIVKQVYDAISVKPIIGGRNVLDDSALQRYINALNRVEKGVLKWSHDREALKYWVAGNARITGAMVGRQISVTDLADTPKSLLDVVYPVHWKEFRDEVIISGGNKLLGILQPGYAEINKAIKAIKTGWPEKREAWEIQGFRVVECPVVEVTKSSDHNLYFLRVDELFIKSFDSEGEALSIASAIQPFVLMGKRGMVDSFVSEEEAIASAKERSRRDKRNVISDKGIQVELVEREGVNRRLENEDVSSERLMLEFGLKGVNFGNWMKTSSARAEAQLHLNHAFDSMHDLADILGVPPTAMSLNGMLGLAIGAQGSGGAVAAHFVPGVNEINLTRTSGAGSLAHEFAHALDHYFATQGGLASSTDPYLIEHASRGPTKHVYNMMDGKQVAQEVPRFGELRPEIVGAFHSIVIAMNQRAQTPEEASAGQVSGVADAKRSLANWLKSIRRDFSGQEDAFDVLGTKIQAGEVGDGKIALGRTGYIDPVVAELRDLYKQKHGRLYSIENIKGLQHWVDFVKYCKERPPVEESLELQQVASDFAKNANALDRDKGGKRYWGTNREKFARAFDAFVSDKLVERCAKNDYLSHSERVGATVPMGQERETINAAFGALINEIKVNETERGAALFSIDGSNLVQGLSIADINFEIQRLRSQWSGMPSVTVVAGIREIPFTVPAQADGVYCDGHVYVIANNIANLKQLQKVMAHECILHHGLEEMLGDYGFSKLHHGLQKLKKNGDAIVGALAQNILEKYGVLPPENETKEIVAMAGEQCLDDDGNLRVEYGFMKGVFAGIASWLRDHGLKIPFSNMELQGIMHDAGEWVKKGRDSKDLPYSGDRLNGVALNSFAGIRAESAPLEALKLAREMRVSGVDDCDIFAQTGWTFEFTDDKPRFEISDVNSHASVVERVLVYPPDQMDVSFEDQSARFGVQEILNVVLDGAFSGKVLDVVDGIVTQKICRDGDVVRHSLRCLSERVAIGEVVDIEYKNGVGIVGGRVQEKNIDR